MITLPRRTWLVLAGAGALAACATLAAKKGPPLDEEIIRFPHKIHQENEVECAACHKAAIEAENLQGRLLPKERTCLRCHSDWKDENQCEKCHLTTPPQTWPARERTVNFNHASHVALEEDCARCHKELPEPGTDRKLTPPMATCLTCHNHKRDYDQARCMPCHLDMTKVPLRPVADFSHQGNFLKEHRLPARTSPETCAQCHEQTFCADCHARTVSSPVEFKLPERVDRQFIHRNDYVSRHQIEASGDPALCKRCHGESFCQKCHTQVGLTRFSQNPRNPHPPGWNLPTNAGFHGTAARRDIVSCAGCHDRGASSNCVDCHKVGGIGGNPHPASFTSKHKASEIQGNATCLACHP